MNKDEKEKFRVAIDSLLNCNLYVAKNVERNSSALGAEYISKYLVVSVRVGGSSGGNCYGDSSSSFTERSEEIKSDIISEFLSGIKSVFSELYELDKNNIHAIESWISENVSEYSDIDSYSDTSDYYGNYTDYKVYGMTLEEIIQGVSKCISIDEKSSQQMLNIISDASAVKFNDVTNEYNIKMLKELENDIKNFESNQNKRKSELMNSKKSYEKSLETINKKIESFEKDNVKSLKELLAKKERLEKEIPSELLLQKPKKITI